MVKTKKKSSNSTFGFPTSFYPAIIPSKADIIRHSQHIRQEHITKHGEKLTAKECQQVVSCGRYGLYFHFRQSAMKAFV